MHSFCGGNISRACRWCTTYVTRVRHLHEIHVSSKNITVKGKCSVNSLRWCCTYISRKREQATWFHVVVAKKINDLRLFVQYFLLLCDAEQYWSFSFQATVIWFSSNVKFFNARSLSLSLSLLFPISDFTRPYPEPLCKHLVHLFENMLDKIVFPEHI